MTSSIPDETITLTFSSQLPVGPGELYVKFTGILNDKMKGFYRNKYTTPSGETRYGAATQFEVLVFSFPKLDEFF